MVWAAARPQCSKSRHHARIVLRATQSHEAASSNRARLASDRVLRRAQPGNASNQQLAAVRLEIDRIGVVDNDDDDDDEEGRKTRDSVRVESRQLRRRRRRRRRRVEQRRIIIIIVVGKDRGT